MNANNVAQAIISWAKQRAVRDLFLVPGSQIDPIAHVVAADPDIRPIVACHELGAGYMADGYARVRRRMSIAISSGGPGALYMLPAAINARIERSPVLFITGDTPTRLGDRYPFQNTHEAGTRDKTLYECGVGLSIRLDDPEALGTCLSELDNELCHNRPAHLVLPFDIQSENNCPVPPPPPTNRVSDVSCIEILADLWNQARAPILILGERLPHNTDPSLIEALINHCAVPVATTNAAKGLLVDTHPMNPGTFGSRGALGDRQPDLLVIIGASLDQQEISDWAQCAELKTIVRLDILPQREQTGFRPHHDLFVDSFTPAIERFMQATAPSRSYAVKVGTILRPEREPADDSPLKDYITQAQTILPTDTILFVDAGRHRMDAARYWRTKETGTFYSSSNQAPMGWGIAAAIGAKLAHPQTPILVITGDGCMRMHGQELAVASRYRIPLTVVVANNRGYGSVSVRAADRIAMEQLGDLPDIDWPEFGRSMGIAGTRVDSIQQFAQALQQAIHHPGPFIIDLCLESARPGKKGPASIWSFR